jgi:hypothetical protein
VCTGDVRGDAHDDGEVRASLEGIGGEGEEGHAIGGCAPEVLEVVSTRVKSGRRTTLSTRVNGPQASRKPFAGASESLTARMKQARFVEMAPDQRSLDSDANVL